MRLTFALLETETDSLECEGGYPESTIPRSQTGDRVGCINVARVRGSREQESARFALASLVQYGSVKTVYSSEIPLASPLRRGVGVDFE